MHRVILAMLLLTAPAFAQKPTPTPVPVERQVLLRNNSASVVREVYLWNPPGTEQGPDLLGPDLLGADVMRPGTALPLRLGAGACRMSLRAVFDDASVELRPMVDVCAEREIVLDDRNTRAIEVVNNTDVELMQLFLARPGSGGRDPVGRDPVGPDRLGAATIPGSDTLTLRLRGEAECNFEARAIFRGSREETRQAVNICTTPRISFGDAGVPLREVSIANRSNRVLRELYATAGTGIQGQDWGADRLGVNVLNPGQSFLLRIRDPACRVRLRAIFADNRAEERLDADICGVQEIIFAPARRLTLVQGHARPVREVYLSAVQEADWGENLLAGRPIATGERRELGTDSGCQADLHVVFDNGNAEEARNINICERAEITLRPGWVSE